MLVRPCALIALTLILELFVNSAALASPPQPNLDPKNDPVSGVWEIELDTDEIPADLRTATLTLELQDDNAVTGKIATPMSTMPIEDGEFDPESGKLTFSATSEEGDKGTLKGTIDGKKIKGKIELGERTIPFSGLQTKGRKPKKAKSKESNSDKKPNAKKASDGDDEDEEKEDNKKKKAKDDEEEEEDEPEEISLSGRFVASQMTPISRRLEEWSSMKIKKVVPHGKQVKSGDVLVTLDMTDIDRAVSDLEHTIEMEKLEIEQARDKLELLSKTTDMDLVSAQRYDKIAREDLDLFMKRDKRFAVEENDFYLKSAKNRHSYQEEELEQLLKMYEADDLTEETEEIILKRTKDQVEMSEFYLKSSEMRHEDFAKFYLKRRQQVMERSAESAAVDLERAAALLPATLREAELSLKKQETNHERSREKLKTLKRDRKKMVIKAPRGGTVYYGKSENGEFKSPRQLAEELRPNGSIKMDDVFMTILELRPVHILADIEESELRHLKKDDVLKATATAFPDVELNAKVKEISKFPVDDGTFSVKLTCRMGARFERVVPGMTCEIKVTPKQEKKDKKKTEKEDKGDDK